MAKVYNPKTGAYENKDNPYSKPDKVYDSKTGVYGKPSTPYSKPSVKYTQQDKYSKASSPYSKQTGVLEFLLSEDGTFLLQENLGKIILRGAAGYIKFNPFSKKTTPYSPKTI